MKLLDAFLELSLSPQEQFKSDMQELINEGFYAVPNLYKVEEETFVGSFKFRKIDAHIQHIIDTSTGQYKNGDWLKISFKEINHQIKRGLFYKIEGNYWLTTYTDEFNQITKDVTVRRCNNFLKWDDKVYPCVIDYEASSSQPVLNEDVNTPNSAIKVIVQGNNDTLALDVNQKFLLGNDVKKRAYKIINYVDYLQNGVKDSSVPLVYLDLQLVQSSSSDFVEEEAKPDIKPYIKIEPEVTEILQGRTVTLNGSVWINGVQVEQSITCTPSNAPQGNYELVEGDNVFTITNKLQSSLPLILTFTSGDLTKTVEIKLRARF